MVPPLVALDGAMVTTVDWELALLRIRNQSPTIAARLPGVNDVGERAYRSVAEQSTLFTPVTSGASLRSRNLYLVQTWQRQVFGENEVLSHSD
jgi:hypothetical protein